jgi:hypothetical protein
MSGTILVCLNLMSRTMRCFSKYIIHPIQTLSPHDAGPSIAVGLYGGLFPVPGTTIFVTIVLIYIMPKKFNTAMKGLVFAVNTVSFPLELILLPYFIQIGSLFFDDLDCDPEQLILRFYDKNTYLISMIQGEMTNFCSDKLLFLIFLLYIL